MATNQLLTFQVQTKNFVESHAFNIQQKKFATTEIITQILKCCGENVISLPRSSP